MCNPLENNTTTTNTKPDFQPIATSPQQKVVAESVRIFGSSHHMSLQLKALPEKSDKNAISWVILKNSISAIVQGLKYFGVELDIKSSPDTHESLLGLALIIIRVIERLPKFITVKEEDKGKISELQELAYLVLQSILGPNISMVRFLLLNKVALLGNSLLRTADTFTQSWTPAQKKEQAAFLCKIETARNCLGDAFMNMRGGSSEQVEFTDRLQDSLIKLGRNLLAIMEQSQNPHSEDIEHLRAFLDFLVDPTDLIPY